MLGILRTTLALMVVAHHLFFIKHHPSGHALGTYAVFGFYIISGYLMTRVMNERYHYTRSGRLSFALNRFLRLYPQYWAAAGLSLLLIALLGQEMVSTFHKKIVIPSDTSSMLQNLFMAFPAWNPGTVSPRLVPPTWALTVEIFFYILICLGISSTYRRVKVWFFLSIAYVLYSYAAGMPWLDRYFPMAAASLPFSVGAAIYFISTGRAGEHRGGESNLSSMRLFLLVLGNCALSMTLSSLGIKQLADISFYLNLYLCYRLVLNIASGNDIANISTRLDNLIGDFSYPIYLLHWQVGLLASFLLYGHAFTEFSPRGLLTLMLAIPMLFATAYLFILLIDHPVQRLRSRVKRFNALREKSV